jgi:hypothetical protein
VQDCSGSWVFPSPFSCSCGRSVGCTDKTYLPSLMNGIFYLIGLTVGPLLCFMPWHIHEERRAQVRQRAPFQLT